MGIEKLIASLKCLFDFHVSKADAFTRHLKRRLPLMVCFGSKADITACLRDVRFTPKSGHSWQRLECLPLCHKRTSAVNSINADSYRGPITNERVQDLNDFVVYTTRLRT
jgi:hypothetical protein